MVLYYYTLAMARETYEGQDKSKQRQINNMRLLFCLIVADLRCRFENTTAGKHHILGE